MESALTEKFKGKKRAPKFADEGPPDMESTARGSGAGAGDDAGAAMPPGDGESEAGGGTGGDSMPDMGGGAPPQADHEQALDDLADVIGVGPQDRPDFANALKAYVQACIAETLGGAEGGPPGPQDMPPAGGEGGEPGGY